jgi:Domain of unknown function (DUF4410)
MNTKLKGEALAAALAASLVLAGCATGKVKINTTAGSRSAMEKYRTVAITLVNDAGPACPDDVGPCIQAAAVRQLKAKFPNVFADIRTAPTGADDELSVEVHITKYKKGSRLARAMLIGLGSSKIATTLFFIDSASKRTVATGQLGLTWALGGIVGASKGIEDLVDSAGAKIANAIVEQRTGKAAPKGTA